MSGARPPVHELGAPVHAPCQALVLSRRLSNSGLNPSNIPQPQPGIIQSDKDNPENKDIVLTMVKDFIGQSRTLIVATVR